MREELRSHTGQRTLTVEALMFPSMENVRGVGGGSVPRNVNITTWVIRPNNMNVLSWEVLVFQEDS